MASERTPDAVVVGGGAIGLAVAWELARRGRAVTVVERDSPAGGATRAAGGMLSPLAEAHRPGPFLALSLASMERYPAFVEAVENASGLDVGYRTAGKLLVALDAAAAEELRAARNWQSATGQTVEWLDGEAARRLEPAIAPEAPGALFIERDHRVDSPRLGRALWQAAAAAGVRFRLGVPAVRLLGRGRVKGVALADGTRVEAPVAVVAAGCWSGWLQNLPRPLPVVPVRGQMAALDASPLPIHRTLMAHGRCYLVPQADGRVLVGSTMERAGFRDRPTAAGIAGLLRAAAEVAPVLGDAPLAAAWAGLRPGTPDELPILGPDPEMEGLVHATGHFRNGILLAPVTAELTADVVSGHAPVLDLAPFSAGRFSAGVPA